MDNEASWQYEQFPERYPDAWKTVGGLPNHADCDQFCDGLDVILMAENAPTYYMIDAARIRGVKTVVVPNYEFYGYLRNVGLAIPDLFLCPSMWYYENILPNKKYLPFPVTPRLSPKPTEASNFLHIAGKPAAHDRNGTESIFKALPFVKSSIKLTIKCQMPEYVEEIMQRYTIPPHVELILNVGNTPNYWDNYTSQHVLLMPRRYGGLCLPVNESLGEGMPVIMTDISPNNHWLPDEWLVQSYKTTDFWAHNEVGVYEVDPEQFATKIDEMCLPKFYQQATRRADELANQYSWETLLPEYLQTLEDLVDNKST